MEWNPDYYYRIVGTWIAKGDDQIIIFNLFNAMPVVLVEEDDEERKRRMAICPEEWGDSFGEEFYDSCIDNSLYYAPGNETWRLSQKSTPLTGQLDFPIMSSDELKASEENLKMIMEKTDD